MSSYPNPCHSCEKQHCLFMKCDPWRIRYLYRQKQINAYARKHDIKPTSPERPVLINPCKRCPNANVCHDICKARAEYWDACLEGTRKRVGL